MILRRYMTRQVASTTALVLGFLVVLLLGGRMIRYFGIAAEGRLDVGLLFAIIGYNLPYFLELVLPLSFFIGLMLVFGRLYVDHEMAVINSSGISRGRLARLMIPFILLLFLLEAGLSLYGKPWGVRNSDNIWQQQSLSSAFDLIRPQSFISSNNYHLYVGSMNEDRTELQDVILVQTGEQKAADSKPDLEDTSQNEKASATPKADVAPVAAANQDGVEQTAPTLSPKADKTITELTKPVVDAKSDGPKRLRSQGHEATFLAVRLPYGVQADEADAQQALDFIQADREVTVNIKAAADASVAAAQAALGGEVRDFVRGNVKARERMVAQYALAGQENLLVVGTDHAAEALTGFYTKYGDGGVDLTPLSGLTKRQGAQLLAHLGAPESTWRKVPTADLEDDRPGLPDEVALGVTYAQIDAYLEGRKVSDEAAARLERLFLNSRHKRALPVTPFDGWWRSQS